MQCYMIVLFISGLKFGVGLSRLIASSMNGVDQSVNAPSAAQQASYAKVPPDPSLATSLLTRIRTSSRDR